MAFEFGAGAKLISNGWEVAHGDRRETGGGSACRVFSLLFSDRGWGVEWILTLAAAGGEDDTTVTAEPGGIAAGGDIKNNTFNQTIIRQDPAVLAATVKVLMDQNTATTEARVRVEREAAALAEKQGFTTEAVTGFLRTLGEQNVPPEKIPTKLSEIATQAVATRQRLAALEPDDPATKALVDQAKAALDKGVFRRANLTP
jgi:hypothetical protein